MIPEAFRQWLADAPTGARLVTCAILAFYVELLGLVCQSFYRVAYCHRMMRHCDKLRRLMDEAEGRPLTEAECAAARRSYALVSERPKWLGAPPERAELEGVFLAWLDRKQQTQKGPDLSPPGPGGGRDRGKDAEGGD